MVWVWRVERNRIGSFCVGRDCLTAREVHEDVNISSIQYAGVPNTNNTALNHKPYALTSSTIPSTNPHIPHSLASVSLEQPGNPYTNESTMSGPMVSTRHDMAP